MGIALLFLFHPRCAVLCLAHGACSTVPDTLLGGISESLPVIYVPGFIGLVWILGSVHERPSLCPQGLTLILVSFLSVYSSVLLPAAQSISLYGLSIIHHLRRALPHSAHWCPGTAIFSNRLLSKSGSSLFPQGERSGKYSCCWSWTMHTSDSSPER